MTYIVTVNDDGTTTIEISFIDEGVNLQGRTNVKGGELEALNYLPVFEADLRRNYADLFPLPLMPEGGMFE
jgi:hypothetical protein